MQHVALTAAIFAGAFFMGPSSSSAPSLSQVDTPHITNIINKPKTQNNETTAQQSASAAPKPAQVKLAAADTTQSPPPAQPAKTVAVADGENLSKIAETNGTTYTRVYDANPIVINPDLIYPGQELRIPAVDEALTPRPLPENAPAEAKAEAHAAPAAQSPTIVSDYTAPVSRGQQLASAPAVAGGSVWDSLAQCEAGGNWSINTGNGFYGGLQFTPSSWAAVGGSGLPNQASREEQIMRGEMLQARQGWGAWPACSAKLGL